ncbi:MAG: histidine kinase dimerization/phosphoacceptor domain -containing protein [Chloroflexales bacterium]
MRLTHHPRWQRLSIAPAAILAALGLRLLLVPLTGHEGPFLLFFSAVMLSAWVGGTVAGALATVLTTPLVTFFFLLPTAPPSVNLVGPLILIGLFVLDGMLISTITGQIQIAAARAARHEAELSSLIDGVQDYAIFLLDPVGNVTTWNTGAARIKGFTAAEIIGQPIARFYTPEDVAAGLPQAALQVAAAGRYAGEGWRVRKDGTRFWASVAITPLHNSSGQLTGFAKVTRDVTEPRRQSEALNAAHDELEARVAERTAALASANATLAHQSEELQASTDSMRASLHEKEVLLKEIHHRVKNNLQVVMSLLRIQGRQVTDPLASAALRDSRQRVEVMALVHELLYRTGDLASIDAAAYIRQLSTQLLRIYGVAPDQVTVSLDAEGVWLSLDQAIPCGLIINELFSNSLKYAFPDGRPGTVGIALHATPPGMITLKVWDTGVGQLADDTVPDRSSLGVTLVHDLVRQLRGTAVTERSAGIVVTISFPQGLAAEPTIAMKEAH